GFAYKSGMAFTLFSKNASGALGRGGRYWIGQHDTRESAVGFTLYMDTVRKAMPKGKVSHIVFVSSRESWSVVRTLQEKGWRVVRGTGLKGEKSFCSHEYKAGKIRKI